MAQPLTQNVLYLPPGVVPPAQPQSTASPAALMAPFGRAFFAEQLPLAIEAFCQQANCKDPMVELLTTDGQRHWVNGIAGASDQWVVLQTSREDHEHPVTVFIPYPTIYRVEIHPYSDGSPRRLGFLAMMDSHDGPRVTRPPANADDGNELPAEATPKPAESGDGEENATA